MKTLAGINVFDNRVKKNTREYKFLQERAASIQNMENIAVVVRLGYHPIFTGLRFKDIKLIHNINLN
jgi:hypothetical protein